MAYTTSYFAKSVIQPLPKVYRKVLTLSERPMEKAATRMLRMSISKRKSPALIMTIPGARINWFLRGLSPTYVALCDFDFELSLE